MICIPEMGTHNEETYPTRLVIFADDAKAHLSFLETSILEGYNRHLPDQYDAGYRVLPDEDEAESDLAAPAFRASRSGNHTLKVFLHVSVNSGSRCTMSPGT
jgi:hypothetical protein